jgi:hypothetical protein
VSHRTLHGKLLTVCPTRTRNVRGIGTEGNHPTVCELVNEGGAGQSKQAKPGAAEPALIQCGAEKKIKKSPQPNRSDLPALSMLIFLYCCQEFFHNPIGRGGNFLGQR